MSGISIKVHPDLALATLRTKQDRAFRIWCLARAVDVEGRGYVELATLHEAAEREKVRGLAPSTMSRILPRGEGIFWESYDRDSRRWLRLHGLARVAQALDLERLGRPPVVVPMPRTLKGFRAVCCFSPFAGDDLSNPFSQGRLAELAGKTDRSVRNWGRHLGPHLETRANAAGTDRTWQRGQDVPDGHYPDYVDGELALLRCLPNSHRLRFETAARGMLRRANRQLSGGHSLSQKQRGERTRQRLFYDADRAVNRRLQQLQEGDAFFIRTEGQARGGARIWQHVRIANGQVHC